MYVLTALVDCPSCEVTFEGQWVDSSMDIEQMDGPPVAEQACTCGEVFEETYPGWSEYGGAG